ncbi:MucBP domain-containing protein [Companilactobacillus sp. DQM5]|uniref:MucBP domain-containing protein n=1 Tax=Companilactobacillus sp. DQM5 TaxID=3463359 RepID=UPI00405A05EF
MKNNIKKFQAVLSIFAICLALVIGEITVPLNISNADSKTPLSIPKYEMKVVGSDSNKFTQGTNIGFDFSTSVTSSDSIPAGTTINIGVGKSIDLSTLSVSNLPSYINVTGNSTTGVITITFKNEVSGSTGNIGFRMTAIAKDLGTYRYTASSTLWGNMNITNPDVEVIKPTVDPTSWGSNYWNGYGIKVAGLTQATFLSSDGGDTYDQPVKGHFTNDGDSTPIVTNINGTGVVDIKPGFDSITDWANAGGHTASTPGSKPGNTSEAYTNGFYALYSIRNDTGAKLDYDHFYVYNTVTKENITNKFKIIKGYYGSNGKPNGSFYDGHGKMGDFTVGITAKEDIPKNESYFAIVMPIKSSSPQAKPIVDVFLQYGAFIDQWNSSVAPNRMNTDHFQVNYDIQPNSDKFIPRMYLDNDNKQVVYGSNKDEILNKHEGVTAEDVEDGDLTSKIAVENDGGLDTSKAGTYEVTYKVTDSDGNTVYIKVHYIVEHNKKAQVIVKYMDEDTNTEIAPNDTFTGAYGDSYSTTSKSIDNYDLDTNKLPNNATGQYTDDPITVTYYYHSKGELTFKSAPSFLSFGTHELFADKEHDFNVESKDADLVISDTRNLYNKPAWTLSGQLTQDFKGKKTGSEMKDILFYNDGSGDKPMALNGTVPIVNDHETTSPDDVNISSSWNNDKGLKIKVSPDKPRADTYNATIQWTLSDGVANK